MKKNYFIGIASTLLLALGAVGIVAAPALAATVSANANVGASVNVGVPPMGPQNQGGPQGGWQYGPQNGQGQGGGNQMAPMRTPGVMGSVSAINGTTLTVASRTFQRGTTGGTPTSATTTYTVDASNATVMKDNATSTVSSIAVGDHVFVQGTVSGTSVTATKILDGQFGRGMMGRGPGMPHSGTSTPPYGGNGANGGLGGIQGNGQPVIAGTVSTINGTSLTLTNSGNTTYTIDASSAVVKKGNATSTVSSISVGDKVIVQGTVNGTSVTASTVIDTTVSGSTGTSQHVGFFGMIGQFFQHLFGF